MVLSLGAKGLVTWILADGTRSVVGSGVAGLDNAAFDDNRMFVSSYAAGGVTEVTAVGRLRPIVVQGFAGSCDGERRRPLPPGSRRPGDHHA